MKRCYRCGDEKPAVEFYKGGGMTRYDWAKFTRLSIDKNAEKMGAPARHAIAWSLVMALHDIADAIRSRGDA